MNWTRARAIAAGWMIPAALMMSGCDADSEVEVAPASDIRMVGERIFPESITSDSAGTLYIGSNKGSIFRAHPGDAEAVEWIKPDADNQLRAVFGVLVDEARGQLWVCSNPNGLTDPPETGPSTLKAFDLESGQLKTSHVLPGAGGALCNDMAIANDGTVYVADTVGGRILTLAPEGGKLEVFAASPDLVGIDGIALADDGTLFINNVRKNLLQRVERPAGQFEGLTDIATSLPLSGPDGLRSIGGNRFLQAEGPGGRVALVTISGDEAEIVPLITGLDFPASMTLVGRTVFVPEGKIGNLFDPEKRNQDPGEFVIRAVQLPEGQ